MQTEELRQSRAKTVIRSGATRQPPASRSRNLPDWLHAQCSRCSMVRLSKIRCKWESICRQHSWPENISGNNAYGYTKGQINKRHPPIHSPQYQPRSVGYAFDIRIFSSIPKLLVLDTGTLERTHTSAALSIPLRPTLLRKTGHGRDNHWSNKQGTDTKRIGITAQYLWRIPFPGFCRFCLHPACWCSLSYPWSREIFPQRDQGRTTGTIFGSHRRLY